jgi:hypothetical protein
MKNIKHFFVVFTLLLTLSISAQAGEMPGAGVTAAQQQPPVEADETDGEMPGAGIIAPLTESMRRIVESILSNL